MNLSESPPIGAVYHKCALQVNPPSYGGHFRGEPGQTSPESHVRLLVEKAVQLGISAIAVTNHNSVSEIPMFLSAAKGTGLHVFPGFELSSSEGVHILCIYEKDTKQEELERYLGEFKIHNTSPSSTLAKQNFIEILEIVREQRGVSIAAHVTQNKGLFKVLHGQSRVNAWNDENLLAIQIPGTVEALQQNYRQIVQNKNPDYKRTYPPEENLAIAVVNAKDVKEPNELADPAATCKIKMSQVCIQGLKQAFLDPGSRIQLNQSNQEYQRDEHTKLISIAWEGGFLNKVELHFNENLNVLIGGRGTGKTTIIESIRAVLGMEGRTDAIISEHRSIVKNVLRAGTKISLQVQTYGHASRIFRIERTLPNPPRVFDDNDELSKLLPADIVPDIEIFGQHEISSLVKDKKELTHLLDRFARSSNEPLDSKAIVSQNLERNRRSLIDAHKELEEIELRLKELPRLQERLRNFIEAGLEEQLREQSNIVREERILESSLERLEPFQDCLSELKSYLPIDCSFVSPKALEDLSGKTELAPLNTIFEEFEKDLNMIVNNLNSAVHKAKDSIDELKGSWQNRKQSVQAEYEKILQKKQTGNLDGEEFINVRRKIEVLQPLERRKEIVKQILNEHNEMRRNLLNEWEEIKAEEFRALSHAADIVNNMLRNKVKIDVTFEGDRSPVLEILKNHVGGKFASTRNVLNLDDQFSLLDFVSTCRRGKEELMNAYDLTENQAERMASLEEEVLMQIEGLELPTTTTISLNVALEGESPLWKELDELSTGQKATAILMHLLLDSEAPLIVDQPEDDLDNRFITESIVPRMREGKQRRQFIFSTHNANIPVLGDAELICGLSAPERGEHGGGQIQEEHLGSIDDTTVRELVEQVLEGGEAAFERRRRKYGF